MARSVPSLLVAVLSFIGLLPSESWGQVSATQLQELRRSHPGARVYRSGGDVTAIYGTQLSTGATPVASARNYLARWEGLYATDVGELRPVPNAEGRIQFGVMQDRLTDEPRFHTFRLVQHHEGLPVFRKGMGFLTRNEPGHPLVLTRFDVVELEGVELAVPVDAPRVSLEMERRVLEHLDAEDRSSLLQAMLPELSEERYVVWAGVDGILATPRLAVSFVITRGSVQTVPDYQKYFVVAAADTGEVLLAETMIHNAASEPLVDVSGTVSGNATDGIRSIECDPESPIGLPWVEVEILGGSSVFADANGNFTIPNAGATAVTVRSPLRGQWFEVRDQSAGNTIPELMLNVTPPGPADFLHNASLTEAETANVNAYLESNVIRDWVLSFEPTFPVIDTQTFFDVNTNLNATCNAFYDGVSINFYMSGGGCTNSAMSDVVYHEYGHHLINVTGNGQGQMGEGTGDTVSVLIQDDPSLSPGWNLDCNTGLRTADNAHQYPCSGAIHDCGQLLSGCVWSTRNELIQTEPADYREINSALFLGMLIVRGQMTPGSSTIDPFITVLYLELDDDDANIGNGTPHYAEIAAGFGDHNMDAPPLELLQFDYPQGRPEAVHPSGIGEFTVAVSGLNGVPLGGSGILHVDRGSGFEEFPMTEIAPDLYEAQFPAAQCGSDLRYYVSANTVGGGTDTDPDPGEHYAALSAVRRVTAWSDDFETNTGWTVSGDALTGHWQRGVPVGGGVRGDPPSDGDGSGQCYVTENAAGNSDVDDGSTVLFSPQLDASGPGRKVLSYYRWYSNHSGDGPFEDTFVVEISNDDGASWTFLETVGPAGPEVSGGWFRQAFLVSDFLTPTAEMRLRFTASDLINGSIVEAGVDGIRIDSVSCGKAIARSPQEPLDAGSRRP